MLSRNVKMTPVVPNQFTKRPGVILLVVLGMLTLFSMLGVSYLVFTSRQRAAAFSISRAESVRVDSESLLHEALSKVLVGSNDSSSSLWGHDLLGDLYGMRDAVRGEITKPTNFVHPPSNTPDIAPAILLNGTFLRFPSDLFRPPNAGFDRYPYRRYEQLHPERQYPGPVVAPSNSQDFFPIDDELTGRLLTFNSGPMAGLTMQIVRYFGDHRGTSTNKRSQLSGQLIVDIRPFLTAQIEIGGQSRALAEWLVDPTFSPHRLLYDGVITPASVNAVNPEGDGFFYINGRILNGPGLGWDVERQSFANNLVPKTGSAFNLQDVVSTTQDYVNLAGVPVADSDFATGGTDVPISLQGHHSLYRNPPNRSATSALDQFLQNLPPGDVDEPYDAPDYNNLWLSYFPDNAALGVSAPSFVRPEILNWLVNQQSGALAAESATRLKNIIYAIQRSTLRPIPLNTFNDNPSMPFGDPRMPKNPSARGSGVLRLSYQDFTGSNEGVGLNAPINMSSNDTNYLAQRIIDLAQALAGRDDDGDGFIDSWDVDNDGNGRVDSVWVDAGLPFTESPEGRLVKPLVAYMIEDMGGRVNANLAGNLAQAREFTFAGNPRGIINSEMSGAIQHTSPVQVPVSTPTKSPILDGSAAAPGNITRVASMPNGFGYGPAEIDLRALFGATYGSDPNRLFRGPQALVRNRLNVQRFNSVDYIASGEFVDLLTSTPTYANGNDIRGVLRNPTRPNLHLFNQSQGLVDHPQGYPVDPFGRTSVGIGVDGSLVVGRGSVKVAFSGRDAGDAYDDPYEFRLDVAGTQPDNPYTFEDLEGLLRFSALDRDLLGSRLVELINNYHNDPSAAPDQLEALRRAMAESLTTHSNSATGLVGTLPSEWRDHQVASTSAASPQNLLARVLYAANPSAANRDLNAMLWQLFPPEVLGGGKFDLNRPFGDGFDNDGDGVIDDPEEVAAGGEIYLRQWDGANPQTTRWSTPLGDVTPGNPGRDSREFFAQQLYTLAMFLMRDASGGTAVFDFPGNAPSTFTALPGTYALPFNDEYRAWKIAQWAVNVADYRDSDAIMSRFDYDPNPFNGWDIVDSTSPPITPQSYRTVWGMENAELTLEESLAFHDRRVRDTANDSTGEERISGGTFMDDDPDQWRVPQGSLFLEVKSTRPPQRPTTPSNEGDGIANPASYPSELYKNIGTPVAPNYVLDLAKEAPDQNPVWRVAISEPHVDPADPLTSDLSPDFLLQPNGSGDYSPPAFAALRNRETASMQPENPDFFGPAKTNRVVDRVIWFSNRNPDTNSDGNVDFTVPVDSNDPARIFYNQFVPSTYTSGGVYLSGGEYAVIGPRATTTIGSLETHNAAGSTHDPMNKPLVNYVDYESLQGIRLTKSLVEYHGIADQRKTPLADTGGVPNASIRSIVGIEAAANPPSGWPNALGPIGVNVSEPLPWRMPAGLQRYYPAPTRSLLPGFPADSWFDYSMSTGALPDEPFDARNWSELFRVYGPQSQLTGTREHFKTAYLQRLADPTQAYNANSNPYITVDYISIDLTVFNGSDRNSQITDSSGTMEWKDNADPDPYAPGSAPREKFASRAKTGHTIDQDPTAGQFPNLVHSVSTMMLPNSTTTPAAGGNIAYFDHELYQTATVDPAKGGNIDNSSISTADRAQPSMTLGYANHSYGSRWTQGDGTSVAANSSITPYIGLPYSNFMIGAAWLNRPFVSPGEMTWVPTTSAGRFSSQFGVATFDAGVPAGANPYNDANNALTGSMALRYDYNGQFPHLWNFFSSSVMSSNSPPNNVPPDANSFAKSPNIWRLLEFVEVPPPYDFEADFVSPDTNVFNATTDPAFSGNYSYGSFGPMTGSNKVTGNPDRWVTAGGIADDYTWNRTSGGWTSAGAGSGLTNGFWTNDVPVEFMRPPFSFRSRHYRNGLINLNTIRSNQVYGALTYGFATDTERAIVYGRNAMGAPGGPAQGGFGALRDDFLDSRRGYSMATIPAAPAIQLRPGLNHEFPTQFAGVFETANGADIAPDLGTSNNLRRKPINSTLMRKHLTANRPLLQRPPAGIEPAQSPERSVVHETLGMTRLANMSSGQSNVYAVWITVGLFEVDASTLTVGQEVGFDTGQAKRLRSFQIIDRSVPVRYEPGVKNNSENVVQLIRVLN